MDEDDFPSCAMFFFAASGRGLEYLLCRGRRESGEETMLRRLLPFVQIVRHCSLMHPFILIWSEARLKL